MVSESSLRQDPNLAPLFFRIDAGEGITDTAVAPHKEYIPLQDDFIEEGNGHCKGIREQVFEFTRERVLAALSRNENNRTRTARELGVCRVTLQKYLKRFHIDAPLPDSNGHEDIAE